MSSPAPPFHLAQLNVARMRAPLGDPLMADFVARIEAVNARADASPGFVWRLETPYAAGAAAEADARRFGGFDDGRVLVNLSVWESVEALRAFVYAGMHLEVVEGRRRWFDKWDGPYQVLWWVPAGARPSVAEARERLAVLATRGPTAEAFTFARPWAPPQAAPR